MSPEYFLHQLQLYQVPDFLWASEYADKSLWLTSRIQSFILAQQWSKKKLKLHDIFELPWDKENEISQDFIDDFQKNHLEELTKYINKQNG